MTILSLILAGCTKTDTNNTALNYSETETQGSEFLESQQEKDYKDYYELKDKSILQYPSSNELFTYNVYQDTIYDYGYYVEITGYNGNEGKELKSITIPEEIEGYKVISISGFSNYFNMSELVLPNSLLCIEQDAFDNCGLTNLVLPESVQYIEEYAFIHNHIEKMNCPKSLISIGDYAFANNSFNSIELNNLLVEIGDKAFAFSFSKIDKLIIPESVKSVGADAFYSINFNQIVIESKDVNINSTAFKLYNDDGTKVETVFWGYTGSSTAQYCANNGCTFKPIQ